MNYKKLQEIAAQAGLIVTESSIYGQAVTKEQPLRPVFVRIERKPGLYNPETGYVDNLAATVVAGGISLQWPCSESQFSYDKELRTNAKHQVGQTFCQAFNQIVSFWQDYKGKQTEQGPKEEG